MVKVNFKRDDEVISTDMPVGSTLMEAAKDLQLREIPADCGGSCACATCHVYIDQRWLAKHGKTRDNTPEIELLYETAIKAGASGGKISGAGGGGFMFFYCPNNTKYDVIKALDKLKMGYHQPFTWNKLGIRTWQIG